MKTIKTLFAFTLLVVGVANAATVATYTVTNSGTITGQTTGTINETGTAVLDDSGSLTLNLEGLTNTAASGGAINRSIIVFTGAYSAAAHTLTITGGTRQYLSCYPSSADNPAACCISLCLGVVTTLSTYVAGTDGGGLPMTRVFNGISYDAVFNEFDATEYILTRTSQVGGAAITTNKMTFTNNAVPVPAAAWLFGSGLLGLFGATRRRAV